MTGEIVQVKTLSECDKADKQQEVARLLHRWFDDNYRPFPWRSPSASAWGILVSEIMSQQTPMARVRPVWEEWMKRWPQVDDVAYADTADIVIAWGNLGYPRRALRLQQCAQAIVEQHHGHVPTTYEELIGLPGVGDYTACAVLCFAYEQHVCVLDTNIRRVLSRVFDGSDQLPTHVNARFRKHYGALLPERDSVVWNKALMEYGALVCTASQPSCGECVIQHLCSWYEQGKPSVQRHVHPQKFVGTDRQARGRAMKMLRDAYTQGIDRVETSRLVAVALVNEGDYEQAQRAVDSLVSDGLAFYVDADKKYMRLPSSQDLSACQQGV